MSAVAREATLRHPRAGAAAAKLAELRKGISSRRTDPEILERHDALLAAIASHSPYLWQLAKSDYDRLSKILSEDPEMRLEAVISATRKTCDAAPDEAQVMQVLRRAKQETALLVAVADLGERWDVVQVTEALTRFADMAVASAFRFLLRGAVRAGRLNTSLNHPENGCGVVVLALGKHGARELNYSSDVDLVVFFDPEAAGVAQGAEPKSLFVRLTKGLVKLLQERTPDGYVLRVDLRLRPDPGSTAIAISLPAAFDYYESVGQNWERAALIKARPVAGDLALGERFIAGLAPFIWRKYFDYAAIADIHAMKRQIHAVRGHAAVTVAGHDVKLGRGGIREIEFFVQTQQLIFGGRRPSLRGARTLDMLAELKRDGWITAKAASELAAAYRFLRSVEHRLQMVADEQTQRLPADAAALTAFAKFCGFAGLRGFERALTRQLSRVEAHYARLFENAPGLDTVKGSLVFTGTVDDPETLDTLRRLGFKNPAGAAETIRGWHFGRREAVQSARAREVLTDLVPGLLDAFSGSGDPDAALAAFDAALSRMPAAVELFALLRANGAIRELFADILGAAPRLARIVTSRPHVLDAAIDPALMTASPRAGSCVERVSRALAQSQGYEEFLDRARDLKYEEHFLIGIRLLAGAIAPEEAAAAYSQLAETLIAATLARVEGEFARDHGGVPEGRCVVVALGKLGSREMSATSDLDLVLIYDFNPDNATSDGVRPLHAMQYYMRLTQRLISALTSQTRRGALYEVDMRLRPSGSRGPLATQFQSFAHYQLEEAETWEHMALTRARVIAGDPDLAATVDLEVGHILARPREPKALAAAVRDMRELIRQAKGEGDDFNLKIAPGGILDIEFIAQFILLLHAHDHPDLLRIPPIEILGIARRDGLIDRRDGTTLIEAHRLIASVIELVATIFDGKFEVAGVLHSVRRRIAAAAGLPDFATLERTLIETRARVRPIFEKLLA